MTTNNYDYDGVCNYCDDSNCDNGSCIIYRGVCDCNRSNCSICR